MSTSAAPQLIAASLLALTASSAAAQTITAREVIDRVKLNVGVPWTEPTVDTIKAGNPDTPIKGVAVTMMATFDVLKRAAAAGHNLVITHDRSHPVRAAGHGGRDGVDRVARARGAGRVRAGEGPVLARAVSAGASQRFVLRPSPLVFVRSAAAFGLLP